MACRIEKRTEGADTYYDIYLTRGDTLYLTAKPQNMDGTDYEPQVGDTIRFAMKKKHGDISPMIERTIDTNSFTMKLEPEDTKALAMDSVWVYDIQLTKDNGDVSTYIRGNLTLTREVH